MRAEAQKVKAGDEISDEKYTYPQSQSVMRRRAYKFITTTSAQRH